MTHTVKMSKGLLTFALAALVFAGFSSFGLYRAGETVAAAVAQRYVLGSATTAGGVEVAQAYHQIFCSPRHSSCSVFLVDDAERLIASVPTTASLRAPAYAQSIRHLQPQFSPALWLRIVFVPSGNTILVWIAIGAAIYLALMGIAVLFLSIWKKREVERELRLERTLAESRESFFQLARQVAHDIRAPVAALNVASAEGSGVPGELAPLIRGATTRILDIANDLLQATRGGGSGVAGAESIASPARATQSLCELVEALVAEKCVQYKQHSALKIEVDRRSSATFLVSVAVGDFYRVLSNLIDNAVQACAGKGRIELKLSRDADEIRLAVIDNGPGIPEAVLQELGTKPVTFGKPDGNGLGIYQASAAVRKWGGRLSIQSKHGNGTQVIISFPILPGSKV